MSEALMFDPGAAARVRMCSRRDNGWSALLVRLLDNAEEAELDLPPVEEQTIVLVTQGTTTIESRHGARWLRADYGPGSIGLTAPGNPTHLRWRGHELAGCAFCRGPGAGFRGRRSGRGGARGHR
jgi:AraC family transcriptional regulator